MIAAPLAAHLVPGLPSEGYAARTEDLLAFYALGRYLVLKAGHAENIFIIRNDE